MNSKITSVNILGASKITLGGLAYSVIENSDFQVLIATGNDSFNGIKKCVLSGNIHLEYPIMYASDSQNALDEFLQEMKQENVRVGIVNINTPLFKQMIEKGNGGIWFSVCRSGLTEKYIPILEENITRTTHICSFDNDKSIAEKAKNLCNNPEIKIHQCIAHSVCSAVKFDYDKQTVYVECGKECQLFFPPETYSFKELFRNKLFNRSELKFTENEEAFNFFSMWKPVSINAIHTLVCIRAYSIGSQQALSMEEIAVKRFSDICSKSEMLEYSIGVYSVLYDKFLKPNEKSVDADKETCARITRSFIEGLYDLKEVVGRGLNINSDTFYEKLKTHIPLLMAAGDEETIKMLDEFTKQFDF